ncbi:hypothetical protein [Streptomyces sp. MMG1533]|uniref:hypothetical protein n=1 Tax=Streptomyces sp. MMG1533 TaxID=1415546 RepID=UPI0006AF2786|nr:hypothetical protein [Streptomyces sp. MMG1533]
MSDDDIKPATYQLVISVDARRSGEYDDGDKPELRKQLYHVVEPAFLKAGAVGAAVHMEDRGDGILATVAACVPPSDLLGVWLVEVHEQLRASNRRLARPLGLRVGMHVGPVRGDSRGVSGRAVDLACRLADCQEARRLMDAAQADLICVVSDLLYQDVVRPGGWGISPETYRPSVARLKEGEVTAWFHLPGLGRVQPSATDPGGGFERAADDVTDDVPEPGAGYVTIGRDQHNHNQPVYQAPVHFGDTRGEAGHE